MKVVIFKKWLVSQGVDVDVFWENCKRKNQCWLGNLKATKRSKLKKRNPKDWSDYCFCWDNSIQKDVNWAELDYKWKCICKHNTITFGFEK